MERVLKPKRTTEEVANKVRAEMTKEKLLKTINNMKRGEVAKL